MSDQSMEATSLFDRNRELDFLEVLVQEALDRARAAGASAAEAAQCGGAGASRRSCISSRRAQGA